MVEALVDAINRGDEKAAADTFRHPRFELIGLDRVYDGREAVERYLRDRRTAFPDQRYELIALYHADDAVIAEFWLLGTHLGDVEGLPASGRAFRCRMATFFVFEGDDLLPGALLRRGDHRPPARVRRSPRTAWGMHVLRARPTRLRPQSPSR
ncbi:MAG: ester cyclase [Acidimicrobiia bacterium]|nr:ester cyclase [Acidimicrobiia bacterium]